jgi:hypothetical protein
MFASKLTLYIRAIKSGYFSLNEFKVMVFNTLLEMNILENELEHFEPIQYNNQYNLLLIQKLIEYGQINKAEEFAEKQISNNVYPEYNVPYLSLLKKIYTQTGEENKKMEIIEKLLPLTYEKEDYLWLYEKLETEEDKKNWRSKIKIRSLNAMRNGNPYAMEFNFWLSFNDGKLKNMFDLLKYNSSLLFAIPYLKYLYELDSIQMLSALILSPCYFDFSEKYELEYQQIIEFVDKNYNSFQTSAVLKNIGRGHYDLRYNPIYSHLSKK